MENDTKSEQAVEQRPSAKPRAPLPPVALTALTALAALSAFVVSMAMTGCNFAEIAKADFSESKSCPTDEVTVTKLAYGDRPPVVRQPGQTSADAAQDQTMNGIADTLADHSYRVDGCGLHDYYYCAQCRGSGCRQESNCHEMDRKTMETMVGRKMITP